MHNLIQDLRYAVRMLRRNPGFTTVAVLALALGIGANTAVFTVVNGVLLRPMPFPEPERLFLVSYSPERGPFDFGPAMVDSHYLEFRRDDKLFEHTAVFQNGAPNLTGAGDPVKLRVANVTPDFLAVVRVNPAMGRNFLPEEGQAGRGHVVLLSEKLWRGRFGADSKILGRSIKLDGVNQTVIGVMPAGFNFPDDAEAWRPLALMTDPGNSFLLPVIGRLKPGVSPQQAQAELETLSPRFTKHEGEDPSGMVPRIVPLKELLVANVRLSLRIFAGAVGFVLLIACANVANLLLARAAGRQQEMSVRAALGASRWRLMRQLLTESTMISVAGGVVGILMALWGVPALLALAPEGKIPRVEQIHIDGWVLAFTIGVSLIAGIAFGLAPAFHAARRELRDTLSQSGRTLTGRHEALRSSLDVMRLVLTQALRLVAVGVVLGLAGALALTRVLERVLYGVRPGDPATLIAVSLLLASVAVAASYIPARRASRVDPVEALRYE